LSEFTGFSTSGQTCALNRILNGLHNRPTAMDMELDNIFTGKARWALKKQDQPLIQNFSRFIS